MTTRGVATRNHESGVFVCFSVGMIDTVAKQQLGEERVCFILTLCSLSSREDRAGTRGRNLDSEPEAGSKLEEYCSLSGLASKLMNQLPISYQFLITPKLTGLGTVLPIVGSTFLHQPTVEKISPGVLTG